MQRWFLCFLAIPDNVDVIKSNQPQILQSIKVFLSNLLPQTMILHLSKKPLMIDYIVSKTQRSVYFQNNRIQSTEIRNKTFIWDYSLFEAIEWLKKIKGTHNGQERQSRNPSFDQTNEQ